MLRGPSSWGAARGYVHFLRPRQSTVGRRLVQNLHFGKPALSHGGWSAQHASRFCFTSSPTMHLACVASDDTLHQPEHNFVRVIPYINLPFCTNGMPSMQIGFVQAIFSKSSKAFPAGLRPARAPRERGLLPDGEPGP